MLDNSVVFDYRAYPNYAHAKTKGDRFELPEELKEYDDDDDDDVAKDDDDDNTKRTSRLSTSLAPDANALLRGVTCCTYIFKIRHEGNVNFFYTLFMKKIFLIFFSFFILFEWFVHLDEV